MFHIDGVVINKHFMSLIEFVVSQEFIRESINLTQMIVTLFACHFYIL